MKFGDKVKEFVEACDFIIIPVVSMAVLIVFVSVCILVAFPVLGLAARLFNWAAGEGGGSGP